MSRLVQAKESVRYDRYLSISGYRWRVEYPDGTFRHNSKFRWMAMIKRFIAELGGLRG